MLAFGRITPAVVLVALLVSACGGHSTEARSSPATTSTGHAAKRAPVVRPPSGFVRACGKITVRRRKLRVDIGGGNGKLITCPLAQKVMRRFLMIDRGQARFSVYRLNWDCYKARPGSPGWRYHCLSYPRDVDVAAGRRWPRAG
jgi:hypothetical protein